MRCISKLTILLASSVSAGQDACAVAAGDRILAAEVGIAAPIRPIIGFAPRPGVTRHFSRAELIALGARAEDAPASGLCVERASAGLSEEILRTALAQALPAGAALQLLDWPHIRIPNGRLVFPETSFRSARPDSVSGVARVSGYVEYDGRKRLPVWAMARITAAAREAVLTCALSAGAVIEPTCLEVREARRYPFAAALPIRGEIAGRRIRHSAAAGTPLNESMLAPRQDVRVREEIELVVVSGAARLKLRAVSETSAAIGQAISVSVAGSRRRLRATLVESGRAELIAGRGSL